MIKPSWSWLLSSLLLALAACSRPAPRVDAALERTEAWPPAFVERFGTLPLQHEGRVMPISTMASFTLYAVHGRRDVQFVTTGDGGKETKHKLSPTEWLLDVWCFPRQAAQYPLFRIENVGVLSELGFAHGGQKQGFEFLTYAQLVQPDKSGERSPASRLAEKAKTLRPRKEQLRSEIENHLVHLYEQLVLYDRLHGELVSIQTQYAVEGDALRAVFGGRQRIGLHDVLANRDEFAAFLRRARESGKADGDPELGNVRLLVNALDDAVGSGGALSLFPPAQSAKPAAAWASLPEVASQAFVPAEQGDVTTPELVAERLAMLASLQRGLSGSSMAEREQHLTAFRDRVDAAAARRGDQRTVALESYYYRANWHFHAMMTLLAAFFAGAVACALPRSRIAWWLAMLGIAGGITMLTADIWIRCLITGHPPIGRLYDTFLFIGGVAAVVLLITEWMLPRRICLVLAPLIGAVLILLARLFEVADGKDTMQPLQAVLLSNFWLTVHVPTMNIGYAATLAAAGIAVAWVVVRVLRIAHPDSTLAKALIRTTYGVSCFGLATAVLGTITGGVWANDSWGRFWGWDPKENGALLICLSQIAMLHARMSGMVRDAGLALWTVASGIIVVFSWFHTNLLGVGLHAYGFSDDLRDGVWISYATLGTVLAAGGLDVLLRPNPAPIERGAPLPAPAAQ